MRESTQSDSIVQISCRLAAGGAGAAADLLPRHSSIGTPPRERPIDTARAEPIAATSDGAAIAVFRDGSSDGTGNSDRGFTRHA